MVGALHDAIDKEAAEHGNKFVTNDAVKLHVEVKEEELDFDNLVAQFQDIVGQLMGINEIKYQKEITVIVEKHLGAGKKVMDCSSRQVDQIALIVADLTELLEKSK